MRIADFGHVSGPVLLFGSPASNLQALQALADLARDRPVICTGDVAAYCAEPAATVAMLRELGWPVVAGNCERQLAADADDCGCGFGAGSACDLLSRSWYEHARRSLSSGHRSWMADLPDLGVFVQDGRRYAVIHGGATNVSRFLWPSSPEVDFAQEIAAIEAAAGTVDGVIAGHCGIAFQRQIGRHRWINAGSLGLPPHDGRPETRHAVLREGDAVIERLAYDHIAARAAMEAAGLDQGYHLTLTTGIWPSEEILPAELRR